MSRLIFFTIMMLNILNTTNSMMTGGFSKQDTVEKCETTLKLILSTYQGFKNYSIKSCETQLVNGINYRMVLENSNRLVKECHLTIYQSFDKTKTTPINYREKENDCFTLFEKSKEKTTTSV